MNYELAKELKDAGYPQKEPNCFRPYGGYTAKVEDDCIYTPTLSELIEACRIKGRDFSLNELKDGWEANSEKEVDAGCGCCSETENIFKEGKTPSEAVAKLWLALNK
jgi:hypothetical protein